MTHRIHGTGISTYIWLILIVNTWNHPNLPQALQGSSSGAATSPRIICATWAFVRTIIGSPGQIGQEEKKQRKTTVCMFRTQKNIVQMCWNTETVIGQDVYVN